MKTEQSTITLDEFEKLYPELHRQIAEQARKEGEAQVRDLFKEFVSRFASDPAFVIEQFGQNATLEQADAAWLKKLESEFRLSPNLQREFGGRLDDFMAFKKAEADRRIS